MALQPPNVHNGIRRTMLDTLSAKLDPRHCCVLVVDLQNDFCADGGYVTKLGRDVTACQAVIEPISHLLDMARGRGIPVVWLHAEYDSDKVPEPMRLRQLTAGKGASCCARGSWGAQPYGLAPAAGELEVLKHSFSGFSGTALHERLQEMGVRSLIIVGVQTNVCVDSTLRQAHSLGYYVVVPRDCVASHMPEEHAATLRNTQFLFGDVVDSAEIAALWSGRDPAAPTARPDNASLPLSA